MTIRLLATSGRGPAECRIALAKALATLQSEAASSGLAIDIAHGPGGDKHGPASAIAVLNGDTDTMTAFANRWTGSILWVAQSPVRPHHKRKNWFIGIARLNAPIAQAITAIAPADVRFETFRAGGPGGQHQNTTDSAVRATHVKTGLTVVSRDARSQHRNKALALDRLAALLASAADLAAQSERESAHTAHDSLERGSPVRRFYGPTFKPE